MQEMIMQILQPKVLTTIATSASMFLLLWFILGRGIFRDLFKLIDERDQKTVGDILKASQLREQAVEMQKSFDAQITKARISALAKRDEKMMAAKMDADRLISQANTAAEAKLTQARAAIIEAKLTAESSISHEALRIARAMAKKVLTNESLNLLLVTPLSAILFNFLFIAPAALAKTESHGGSAHGSPDILGGLFWPGINFLITLLILSYIYKKHLASLLVERRSGIQKQISEATAVLQEANNQLAAISMKLHKIEEEVSLIAKEHEEQTKRLLESVSSSSAAAARRIASDVERHIREEERRAQQQVRLQILNEASGLAQQIVIDELSPSEDRSFRQFALAELDDLSNRDLHQS